MVLVLNCMKSDKLAESFDRAILRPLEKIGKTAEFLRVPKVEILPGPSEYSHVLISGSEASVMDDNAWDARLQTIILETMEGMDLRYPAPVDDIAKYTIPEV